MQTQQPLGFGRYQFQLDTRLDNLDPNVVLGLFPYPAHELGPDGTNEIDIELAGLNYTVWPTSVSLKQQHKTYEMNLSQNTGGYFTTHRFTWRSNSIYFQSHYGHRNDNTNQFASWSYQPADPTKWISQSPMLLHINLWCFHGTPPINEQPVEVIISNFKYQAQ